jgi:hypothetical protein
VQQEEKKRLTCLESYLHGQRDEPALLLDEINCTLSSSTRQYMNFIIFGRREQAWAFFFFSSSSLPTLFCSASVFPVVVVVAVAS